MKMLLATAALVTLIASPVLAQSVNTKQTHVRANSQAVQTMQFGRTENAENGQRHSTNPAFDVYDTAGHYVGSDPDPRIRQELLNDQGSSD
jgi:Tfp pilus assembly protein FimT